MRARTAALLGAAFLLTCAGESAAQQLSYTPINPSFGGNPFNSSHLLGLAGSQNQFRPKTTTFTAPTQAQQFASQLQSTILAGVSQQISNAIFGNNPQQSGTISFGGTSVNFARGLDNVTINITDTQGVTTTIVVPTFVATGG